MRYFERQQRRLAGIGGNGHDHVFEDPAGSAHEVVVSVREGIEGPRVHRTTAHLASLSAGGRVTTREMIAHLARPLAAKQVSSPPATPAPRPKRVPPGTRAHPAAASPAGRARDRRRPAPGRQRADPEKRYRTVPGRRREIALHPSTRPGHGRNRTPPASATGDGSPPDSISTKTTCAAPRDNASSPSAPLPA